MPLFHAFRPHFMAKYKVLFVLAALGICSLIYLGQQDGVDPRYQALFKRVGNNEAGCRLPNPDPWDETILHYIEYPGPLDCKQVQLPLTYLDSRILKLNNSALKEAGYSRDSIKCQFRCFQWKSDDENQYLEWNDLNSEPIDCEFIEVSCSRKMLPISIYSQLHAQAIPKFESSDDKQYSVTMFVIDSISQSHLKRGLNQTLSVLTSKYGSRIMNGFTKVADNSFPNAVAFLTGKDIRIDELPGPQSGGHFDDWNFIWKDFKKSSHVTYYAEDYPDYNLFNYLSKGFTTPPVDHYFRPFWRQVYDSMVYRRSTYLCYNTEPMHRVQLRYLKEFLQGYSGKKPTFALNWLTELAHDRLSQVSSADPDLAAFFDSTVDQQKDSFLFVFSDHGHRFDPIRQTMIGRLEERMPFFTVHIPESLKKKVPGLQRIIDWNSKQLTSFYDLYVTLQDINYLNQHNSWDELAHQKPGFTLQPIHRFRRFSKRGLSLLRPIPADRNCDQAGIPEEYCICQREKQISKEDPVVKRAAEELISEINKILKPHGECAQLSLTEIRGASSSLPNADILQKPGTFFHSTSLSLGAYINYLVMVSAAPSNAIFEGVVRHDISTDKLNVVGEINRINRYGNQSVCVHEQLLRKFCYCI
ncbi:unnamed protein product [Bursaphelenchus xylophilus]|uniref:(pine wood nematode) hypothetical protein n=1 Tax=Bursaphelenchus xylophilus TaxID=6326 RepID=A0A1I7RNX8_BURXY|nr:unnamed protein product [Bursaphelenchus xylophilus]CAG9124370.1 unnamed protein product [Bursaphelenchus xylophilus]